MEQLNITNGNKTQEESAATVEAAEPKDANTDREQVKKFHSNLLYEEYLGFIPGTLRGKEDPRYVFAKFDKQYKNFDFTNEDFLEILKKQICCNTWNSCRSPRPRKAWISSFERKMTQTFSFRNI